MHKDLFLPTSDGAFIARLLSHSAAAHILQSVGTGLEALSSDSGLVHFVVDMHHPVHGDIAQGIDHSDPPLKILVLVEERDESQVLQLFPYCVSEMETAADYRHSRNAVSQRLDHRGFKIDDYPLWLVSSAVHVQLLQNGIPHQLFGILSCSAGDTTHRAVPSHCQT
jgi:hypothetical protein